MKFAAHGQFELDVEGRTILLTLYGEFNREGVETTSDALQAVADKHFGDNQPWAVLLDLSQQTLATAESEQAIYAAYEWSASQHQRFEAVVGSNSPVQRHQMEKFVAAHGKAIEYRFFENSELARQWLGEKGML